MCAVKEGEDSSHWLYRWQALCPLSPRRLAEEQRCDEGCQQGPGPYQYGKSFAPHCKPLPFRVIPDAKMSDMGLVR